MNQPPRASVVAVGNELLGGGVSDTNTARIASTLQEVGIELLLSLQVRDETREIVDGISHAMGKTPLVFVCGGIGPTEDDLTREAVAEVLGRPLRLNEEAWSSIESRLRERGVPPREGHKRQAMIPEGAIPLPNEVGSAWGALAEREGRVIVMLPGVPREVIPMLKRAIPLLPTEWRGTPRVVARVRSFGLPESEIDRLLKPLWREPSISLGLRVLSPRHVEVRITGKGEKVEEAKSRVATLLQDHAYSTQGEELEEVVGRLLTETGKTIATAESCTGGMIAHTITNVPGSSRYMLEGLVTYSNEAKERILGVSRETLVAHGAVSRETAQEMVKGLKGVSGAHCCVAVTGIAGPGGGTPQKPVGLVFAGFYLEDRLWVREYRFAGSRLEIKGLTTLSVLNEVRLALEEAR